MTTPVTLSAEQAAFLQGPLSMNVGAVGRDGWPCVCRAHGAVLARDRRALTVLLSSTRSRAVLDAIDAGSGVTLVASRPATHATLQFKAATAERVAVKARHRALNAHYAKAFGGELAALGFGDALVEGLVAMLTASDLVALRFVPQIVFDQTPGPQAGRVLMQA